MTETTPNPAALGHDVFVSSASQDAADCVATASGVVTQVHVAGRRRPIALRIPCCAQARGIRPSMPVRRTRLTHGG